MTIGDEERGDERNSRHTLSISDSFTQDLVTIGGVKLISGGRVCKVLFEPSFESDGGARDEDHRVDPINVM